MRLVYCFLLFIFLFSCEDSEVCEDDYTPLLYIDFKNKATGNLTNRNNYFVVLTNDSAKETNYKIESNSPTLKLPLSLESNNKTKSITIFLEENATDTQKLVINFNYELKPEYISKACGFRYTFEQVDVKASQLGFAIDVSQNTNKIENEFSSHITVFD